MKRVVRLGSIGAVGLLAWLVAILTLGDLPHEQYFVIRVVRRRAGAAPISAR